MEQSRVETAMTEVKISSIGDVICGGFFCADFSSNYKRLLELLNAIAAKSVLRVF